MQRCRDGRKPLHGNKELICGRGACAAPLKPSQVSCATCTWGTREQQLGRFRWTLLNGGEPRGRDRGFVLRRGGSLLCPRLARGFVRIRSPLARAGLVVAHEQTRRFLTFQSWVPWAGAGPAAALCGGTAARRPRAQSAARTPAAPRRRRRSGNIPRGAAAASLTRSPCSSAVRARLRGDGASAASCWMNARSPPGAALLTLPS